MTLTGWNGWKHSNVAKLTHFFKEEQAKISPQQYQRLAASLKAIVAGWNNQLLGLGGNYFLHKAWLIWIVFVLFMNKITIKKQIFKERKTKKKRIIKDHVFRCHERNPVFLLTQTCKLNSEIHKNVSIYSMSRLPKQKCNIKFSKFSLIIDNSPMLPLSSCLPATISLKTAQLTNSADLFLEIHTWAYSVWTASVNPRVSTAFIIIIIKEPEKQSNRRTQTPHFLLCAIINHHTAFPPPPSLLKHQLKPSYKENKKFTCIFNFILQWLTQRKLPPFRTPFGRKSLLNMSQLGERKNKDIYIKKKSQMKNYLNYCQTSNEVLFIFSSSQSVVLLP